MAPFPVRQEAVELPVGELILRGMLHRPVAPGRYPALVLYHGFTGQKAEKNFLFVRLSRLLAPLGFVCVRFDFGGSGESDGDFAAMTFGGEVAEAKEILSYTRSLPFVDPGRVFLLGLSMGGAIASIVAGDEPEKVRGLILWAPAGTLPVLVEGMAASHQGELEKYGWIDIGGLCLGRGFLDELAGWDIYGRAAGFSGPVLLIHGDGDQVVPIVASYRYKEVYGPRARLHVIPGGDHTFNAVAWAEEVLAVTRDFLLGQAEVPGKTAPPPSTTPALSIRHAVPEDLPAIEAIYNEAGIATTASFDLTPRSPEEARAWFAAHDPTHPIFVAVRDGRIIGWAALSPYSPRGAYRYTVEDSVYVHPAFHRQGVGRALLTALIEAAAGLGYRAVVAKIVADNEASLALHRQVGFVHVGRLRAVGYKFGRWLDVDLLELLLPEGPRISPDL